jgi:hypothetical protein
MFLYSSWVLAPPRSEVVSAFAAEIGAAGPGPFADDYGAMTVREVDYRDPGSSPWVALPREGTCLVGFADVEARDAFGSRLVGAVSPSAALTDHLLGDLVSALLDTDGEAEPVVFALGPLLDLARDDAVHPTSIRLGDDVVRILVQSEDGPALLDAVNGLPGDRIGVTLRVEEGRATVSAEGPVIFTDAVTPLAMLAAIGSIATAARSRTPAGA